MTKHSFPLLCVCSQSLSLEAAGVLLYTFKCKGLLDPETSSTLLEGGGAGRRGQYGEKNAFRYTLVTGLLPQHLEHSLTLQITMHPVLT